MIFANIFAAVAKGADWYEEFLNTFLPALDADIAALLGRGAVSGASFSIGTGSKAFPDLVPATTELPVDMRVRIRRRGDPTTFMLGAVTASAAGSVTVNVDAVGGSGGPYTDWLITADVTAAPALMVPRALAGAGTVTLVDHGNVVYTTGSATLAFDPVATLGEGFWCAVVNISGTRVLDPDSSDLIEGAATISLAADQSVIVAVIDGALRVVASKGYGGGAAATNQAGVDAATSTSTAVPPAYLIGASYLNVRNYAVNPEGLIWQRNNAASATDNAYYQDRWRVLAEAPNVATPSQLTSSLPTGCENAIRLTVGSTNNRKFGLFQPIEGSDVIALRGKTICLSAQLQATVGIADVRMAIVEFTGTKDAVSGDPVSAWNSAGTVPTLAANWAYVSTGGAPANLSVTTSFARYSVTGAVGATATNLAVLIWSEDQTTTTTTDKLDVTQVVLSPGGAAPAYSPRPYEQELALCQRFCQVIDCSVDGSQGPLGAGSATSSTSAYVFVPLPVMMRATPTFSVNNANKFELVGADGTIRCTAINAYVNRRTGLTVTPTVASGLTAGNGVILEGYNATADGLFTILAEL